MLFCASWREVLFVSEGTPRSCLSNNFLRAYIRIRPNCQLREDIRGHTLAGPLYALVRLDVRPAQLRVALIVEVLLVKSLTIFHDQPNFFVIWEQLLDKCYRSIQVRPAVRLISGGD